MEFQDRSKTCSFTKPTVWNEGTFGAVIVLCNCKTNVLFGMPKGKTSK